MKIISIVGARPNFMKIAPFIRAIEKHNRSDKTKIQHILVHTGQHYDIRMSQQFFDDLNIPPADIHLEIGSGTHAEQVGKTMMEFEKVIRAEKPDWVVVVGDVNAVCAAAITSKKENIKLAHIEAGLRSGDITMPEEVNRIVADRLSDLLFTPDHISETNLHKEGIPADKIKFVGNIMIDTLYYEKARAEKLSTIEIIKKNILAETISLPETEVTKYAIVTLHRPSNVDNDTILAPLVNFLKNEVSKEMAIIWTLHPRTLKQLKSFSIFEELTKTKNLYLLHPLGYHEMLSLNSKASIILTDSGGLQAESAVLGTPCLIIRQNTEWLITLRAYGGESILVGNDINMIRAEFFSILSKSRTPSKPELWDGNTAERIVKILVEK